MSTSLIEQAQGFLADGWRMGKRQWFYDDYAKVYLKMILKVIEGEPIRTFALATIEVEEPYRQQGYASTFIRELHLINPFPYSYIECVIEPILAEHLEKEGWLLIEDQNYYKATN